MQYLIITNFYPSCDYEIGKGECIRLVKNPYGDIKEASEKHLPFLNGQIWKYSIVVKDSFKNLKELVFFHSFVTNNIQTYHYAENSSKLFFDEDDLLFPSEIDKDTKTNELVYFVDFNKFPLLLSCNRIPTDDMKYSAIDYSLLFESFVELKKDRVSGVSGTYNLYEMILLYEFAKSFEVTHRLYNNANLPLSFYITILESLIGKPDSCSESLTCKDCGAEIQQHFKTSLEKHFKKYFQQFKGFREIRHKTFHGGCYFDFDEFFSGRFTDNTFDYNNNKTIQLYRHKREELECSIRILLTNELLGYHKKRSRIKKSPNE